MHSLNRINQLLSTIEFKNSLSDIKRNSASKFYCKYQIDLFYLYHILNSSCNSVKTIIEMTVVSIIIVFSSFIPSLISFIHLNVTYRNGDGE